MWYSYMGEEAWEWWRCRKHCPGWRCLPKRQCQWHSSPREDYEAPTILSTIVACASAKHLTIIIVFFFACAVDINSIWLVGWLSSVSYLPTQKTKRSSFWPPQSNSKAVSIRLWAQPLGCFHSWMNYRTSAVKKQGYLKAHHVCCGSSTVAALMSHGVAVIFIAGFSRGSRKALTRLRPGSGAQPPLAALHFLNVVAHQVSHSIMGYMASF